MKIICKLAWKNVVANGKRMLFTLLCVVLSVSIIGIVLGITDSLLQGVDFEGNAANESAVKKVCRAL